MQQDPSGAGGKSASSSASAASAINFGSMTTPEGGLSTMGVIVIGALGLLAFIALVVVAKK